MIPNLFILSSSGEVLIEKQWVGNTKRSVTQLFWEELSKQSRKDELSPVISTAKYFLVHVQRFELYLLTVLTTEQNSPLLVLECHHKVLDILVDYLGSCNELTIRENFSTVYQILDEMFDGGFPATTELNQLKDMIMPPSLARRVYQNVTGEFSLSQELPSGAVSKIPWRKADVQYVTNEVYFDIVEQIDAQLNASGVVQNCSVYGEIRSNCRLTGMPDLTLTFTRPELLDEASLHRCVRINRFQREKLLSFVPPDGNFVLASYRVPGVVPFPIYIKPMISYKGASGRVQISVGPRIISGEAKPISNVAVIIPFPLALVSHNLTATVGTTRLDPKTQILRWEIGKLPKDENVLLEGTLNFPADWVCDESPIVRGEFTVKMMTATGLKVDGLAIRGVSYKPFKGVRSITQAGKFQISCQD